MHKEIYFFYYLVNVLMVNIQNQLIFQTMKAEFILFK